MYKTIDRWLSQSATKIVAFMHYSIRKRNLSLSYGDNDQVRVETFLMNSYAREFCKPRRYRNGANTCALHVATA